MRPGGQFRLITGLVAGLFYNWGCRLAIGRPIRSGLGRAGFLEKTHRQQAIANGTPGP